MLYSKRWDVLLKKGKAEQGKALRVWAGHRLQHETGIQVAREGREPWPSFQQLDLTYCNSSSTLNNTHLIFRKQWCQWIKRGRYTCIKAHFANIIQIWTPRMVHLFWVTLAKMRRLWRPHVILADVLFKHRSISFLSMYPSFLFFLFPAIASVLPPWSL